MGHFHRATNATGGAARGVECTAINFDWAVKKQFDHWFGRTFTEVEDELGP